MVRHPFSPAVHRTASIEKKPKANGRRKESPHKGGAFRDLQVFVVDLFFDLDFN